MDSISGAYDLTERVQQLEYEVKQLKKDIEVLGQVIDKLRPKYYKLQSPITPSATPGSAGS